MLSPNGKVQAFHIDPKDFEATPVAVDETLREEAIAYYQSASYAFARRLEICAPAVYVYRHKGRTMINPGQAAPWCQVAVALLLSMVAILAPEYFTNIDIWLEDWFFDAALHDFPWRNHWFATDFAHGSLKNVIIQGGTLLLVVMLIDQVWRIRKMDYFWRYRLQIVAWSSVLVPAVIRGIKRLSVLNCPWDIDRYGGHAPYLKLFDQVPAGWVPGYCFPAGHASTGLWLAALCVFWLPQSPRKALAVFWTGLSVRLALGWIQQMRGVHLLSHTLWSGWMRA